MFYYAINLYAYDSSTRYLLTHSKHYTQDQFSEICDCLLPKAASAALSDSKEFFGIHSWVGPIDWNDVVHRLIDLLEDKGFRKARVPYVDFDDWPIEPGNGRHHEPLETRLRIMLEKLGPVKDEILEFNQMAMESLFDGTISRKQKQEETDNAGP